MEDPAPLPRRPLDRFIAERRIKAIAAVTSNIKWSFHALERMEERGIPDVDVLRILRQGVIAGPPRADRPGEWTCKMVRTIRGRREAGFVVIILLGDRLLVKTVEWEDTG